MSRVEDICNAVGEEEEQGTYTKLSVTPAIKKDTSVTIAPSIRGTDPVTNKIGPRVLVKDEML